MRDRLPPWQTLSLKEKIGQMIVVRAAGHLFDNQIRYPQWEASAEQLQHWLADLNIGGVILLGGSAAELSLRSRQLQIWSRTPLLIAADIEEGVGQRFSGATWFPPPMALSAIEPRNRAADYAAQMGAITAREALAIGINWMLAPVVDVNNNPANPVINIRAFGETPQEVSHLAPAFIRGAKPYPILTTAKHFPGHGDTATDSHLELPVLPHSAERLTEVELPPFRSAIAAGVDSIMSAHLLIPAWDDRRPATFSQPILTGQLRGALGFDGLIVTDALVMAGATGFANCGELCVAAIEAGADILLMPEDPEAAIAAIYEAAIAGRLSEHRINASVQRIWRAKHNVFPADAAIAPPLDFAAQLAQPDAAQVAAEILQQSLQVGGSPPLPPAEQGRNLIVVDNLLACPFLDASAPAIAFPQQLGYKLQLSEQQQLAIESDPPDTFLQVFSRGNPFRAEAGLTSNACHHFKNLLNTSRLVGLAIYGSPYLLEWFRPHLPSHLPWTCSYGQMPSAQKTVGASLYPNFSNFLPSQGEFI